MSVSACLFASISRELQSNSHQILCTYGRGLLLLWQRCDTLCTSGFVVRHVRAQWPRIDDAKRRIPVLKWLSRGQKGFDNAAYTQADCTGQHRIGAEFDIGLCDCCVSREVAAKCLKQVQVLFKNVQGHKRMISQYHVKIRYTASSERIASPAQTDSKSSELRWPNVATLHLWFRPNSHPLSLNIRPNCPFW